MILKDIFEQVEKNIDSLVAKQVDWAAGASREEFQAARAGKLKLHFFDREVPDEWLSDIKGKKVLCLAGAGGLQAPLLACAGAKVTVIDLSDKMLDQDRAVAERENLQMEIVKGNMCDLSMFGEGTFDYIINPPSLMYVPEPGAVFRECYRVLSKGGVFIMMAPNPINYVCDHIDDADGGYYKAVHRMPFCSTDHDDSDWIEYGNTRRSDRLRFPDQRIHGMPDGRHHRTVFYDEGSKELISEILDQLVKTAIHINSSAADMVYCL